MLSASSPLLVLFRLLKFALMDYYSPSFSFSLSRLLHGVQERCVFTFVKLLDAFLLIVFLHPIHHLALRQPFLCGQVTYSLDARIRSRLVMLFLEWSRPRDAQRAVILQKSTSRTLFVACRAWRVALRASCQKTAGEEQQVGGSGDM